MGVHLIDLRIRGTPLTACQYVEIIPDELRVYFLLSEPGKSGFDFYVTHFVCADGSAQPPYYDDPSTEVECLFHGIAYFDGIRHLYMGDKRSDNYGYLYYPDTLALTRVLGVLQDLERRFCQELHC